MKAIPREDVVKIVEFWVSQSWPLDLAKAEEMALGLGWERIEEGLLRMPYPLTNATATLTDMGKQESVAVISFRVTDVVLEQSLERDAFMNDVFVGAVAGLQREWQKPKMRKSKEEYKAQWHLSNGCEVYLSNRWRVVSFVIFSPEYAEVERYLRGRR